MSPWTRRRGQATPPNAAPLLPRSSVPPSGPPAPSLPVRPRQRWIRCVDHIKTGRIYPLDPAKVVYFAPAAEGWWMACDILGRSHRVSTDDDARVEALMGSGR
jgi:hypothetical protein